MTEKAGTVTHGFSNNQIDTASLPALQDVKLESVAASYRALNLFICVSVTLGILGLLTLFRYQSLVKLPQDVVAVLPAMMVLVGTVGIGRLLYHFLADPKLKFALRENDLILQRGLFFRSLICQPVLRIQHVELTRGPLDRWVGIASLKVYSAGGTAHTFEIPGLELEKARQLKHFIVHHNAFDAK